MDPIKLSVQRPVALIACVLIVLLFGLVALNRIPVQLAPDVQQPTISISTSWPGASPSEIEREIVERQEDALKGIENLKSMTASADRGRGRLTLEFASDTNMDRVLLLVANQLRQINGYPDEVREPTLSTAGTDDNPVAYFSLLRLAGNERPIEEYGDLVEDLVRERLQRVEGVSEVDVFGGAEQRLEVRVKPEALARYRLSVADLIAALNAANVSASAGDVEEGKRSYVVRTDAELSSAEAVKAVVVRSGGEEGFGRVTLGEIAEVGLGYTTPTARIRQLGQPALSLSVTRESGANVIVVMRALRQVVAELNEGPLKQARLQLIWNYDETDYIDAAIQLVEENIYIGAALAALVLFAFLRSFGATLVVSLSIPVSLIGAFVAMAALGRSINVISLAGLAFGIGMAIDSAIVVNENVFRLRERGLAVRDAAIKGAQQVWGAVFAGALTTVLVFLPLLVLDVEVGQLFRDLAVALSVTTLLSLLVAITVVPSLAARLLSWGGGERLKKLAAVAGDHAPSGPFTRFVVSFTAHVIKRRSLSLGMVAAISLAAAGGTWLFLPKLEYLPEGNRNLVSGRIGLPPGYNLATVQEIAAQVEAQVSAYWDPEGKTAGTGDPDQPPAMQRFFFIVLPTQIILGATAVDPERASELVPVIQALLRGVPGGQGTTYQPSIFGRGVSGGRSIELDVTGPDLETLLPVAQRAFAKLSQLFPRDDGNQLRSNPGLELGAPELHVVPDLLRLADVGLTAKAFAQIIDAFNDGLTVTEVTVAGQRIDLTLLGAGGKATSTQAIGQIPVVTPGGTILPASALGRVELAAGPVTIRHRDRQLTITLELRPAKGIPLESALESVKAEVVEAMTDEGLPLGVAFQLSGTADKLEETWQAMVLNLMLAMIVTYLVMAILFESFVYPLVMMLSVPLAAAGGVAGLAVTNFWVDQPLDMLTLIGFVILIGTVVNNSILIVHQALFHLRHEKMPPQEAILEATRNRIRPIFMSTITAVVSMLPLVIAPGAGSELYRGIGAVVVGGLSLSAVLTLFVVPPMLSLVMGLLERKRAARHLAHEVSHPS